MRVASGLLFFAFLIASSSGCGKKDSISGEGGNESIEGTYLLTGIESAGNKVAEAEIAAKPEKDRTIQVTTNRFLARIGEKEDPASYTIDKTQSPAHIDMVSKKQDGSDEKMYGIFKLDGDFLMLCVVESDKAVDRPKDFKTEKGSKSMLMTLKKKK